MFPRPIYRLYAHHNCRNVVVGSVSNRSGLSKFEICGTRENSIRKSVIAAHDVQALARCCSPRADVTVCTPYGLSDLAAALFGNRSCQASVQPGRRELRSEGINAFSFLFAVQLTV